MKIKYFNLKILIILLLVSSCDERSEIEPTCYQDENRPVVATYTNVPGTINAPSSDICGTEYTLINVPLTPERSTNPLVPCNLPDNFKKGGLDVIISGFLFDVSDLNICAQYFEITSIKERR
jgi:hypothetical protein